MEKEIKSQSVVDNFFVEYYSEAIDTLREIKPWDMNSFKTESDIQPYDLDLNKLFSESIYAKFLDIYEDILYASGGDGDPKNHYEFFKEKLEEILILIEKINAKKRN